ncbi:MAG: GNAT family N-acetyltransferase [Candidatus Kerfeldbacteria bacterium]|nr:GNAT family N-acetyltransferase [Candidatus Kerfeldbacteria bacterium]
MPALVLPDTVYRDSFLAAAEELRNEGRERADAFITARTFDRYVERLHRHANGDGLPPTWVPYSEYWLTDDAVYLGRVSIRHRLNEKLSRIGGHIGYVIRPTARRKGYGTLILRLALPIAQSVGIVRALLTCDEDNIASRKIIEANGGVYEASVEQGNGLPDKRRYWIDLANA